MIGANAPEFFPATITTKSVERSSERMAAERNVSEEAVRPSVAGGHASSALSVPMRDDSPAARITPPKLGARNMLRKIAESEEKVSEQNLESENGLLASGVSHHRAFDFARSSDEVVEVVSTDVFYGHAGYSAEGVLVHENVVFIRILNPGHSISVVRIKPFDLVALTDFTQIAVRIVGIPQ